MTGLTKWARPSIVREWGDDFRPGLFTWFDRGQWEQVPASYHDSLGEMIWPDDEPDPCHAPRRILGSWPWDEIVPRSKETVVNDGSVGPRPPQWAGPYRWMEHATCARPEYSDLDFTAPNSIDEALEMILTCESCPVFEQCRYFAAVTESSAGAWAGRISDNRWVNLVRRNRSQYQERTVRREERREERRKHDDALRTRRIAWLRTELERLESTVAS